MHVLMLETRRGSEDGFTVRQYKEGERYDMADSLARYFIFRSWAAECDVPHVDMGAHRKSSASLFSFRF